MSYKRILVPVDGSATSTEGLREAIELARAQGAALRLVHVADEHLIAAMGVDYGASVDKLLLAVKAAGRGILRKAEGAVRRAGLQPTSVMLETLTGPVAEPVVQEAKKWRADLIVIGTHGRRGVRRLVLGSDAEQIVRLAPVPVLLVRASQPVAAKGVTRRPEASRRVAAIPGYQRGV